jgi:hypothetical protein
MAHFARALDATVNVATLCARCDRELYGFQANGGAYHFMNLPICDICHIRPKRLRKSGLQ